MGTRVRSCVRLRSCAGADDALIRGICASAAPSPSLACIYIHARLATPMHGSPMRARRTRAPTFCVRARARVRVRLGSHASAPTRASAFRRRGPRVARLAGVPLGIGVQREHRRLEHRRGHRLVLCMRRLFGPAARHRRRDALGGSSMRRGPLCVTGPPMRARV